MNLLRRRKFLINELYDLLREPEVGNFSDGQTRNMSNIVIICTGNVGIKQYQSVPQIYLKQFNRVRFRISIRI